MKKESSVIGPSKIEPNWKEVKNAKEFLVKHKIPTAAYDSFTADTVEKDVPCYFKTSCTEGRRISSR
jgi:phosphoribosylamine--glycine ligase